MLGFSALSENPISSVNKVLELSASMTGLSVASSAAAGTLIGASTMSAISLQTTAGVRILGHSSTLESTSVASSSAVFIKGSTLETDLLSSFTQGSAAIRNRSGIATASANFIQSALGEKLFENLSTQDSVESFSDLVTSSSTENFTDLNTQTNTETFTDLET